MFYKIKILNLPVFEKESWQFIGQDVPGVFDILDDILGPVHEFS